jgi:hypothetical protein
VVVIDFFFVALPHRTHRNAPPPPVHAVTIAAVVDENFP